jgi:hypothetical protein
VLQALEAGEHVEHLLPAAPAVREHVQNRAHLAKATVRS